MRDWTVPTRQSAFGIFMFAGKALRDVIAILLILTGSFSRKDKPILAWILLYGSATIYVFGKAFLEYFYFRFYISEKQLIIKKGIFSKKTLIIPFEKIQTVQLHQNLLHKIIGHCKVAIDTAGTDKVEVAIHSLLYKEALDLKHVLSQENFEEKIVVDRPAANIIRLAPKDLFKMALSANHLETFGLIIAFVIARFQDVKDLLGIDAYDYFEEHQEEVAFTAESIGIIVFFTLAIAILASIVRIILRFSDLTIQLTEKGFHLKHGLLNSQQQFIGSRKIQFIMWKANWIRKKIGMYMFYVKTAGEDALKKKQKIHVPVTRNEHLQQLAGYYQTDLPSMSSVPASIQQQYVYRRFLLIGLPVTIIVCGLLFTWWKWYSLWFLIWLSYFVIAAFVYRKNFRIWTNENAIEISRGVWGTEKIVVNWNKIQLVIFRQSIYQKKNGLATLSLHTASGEVILPYLTNEEAKLIADYAAMKVECSGQSWM